MAITVEMREQVSQLYVALFGRAPDGEGLGYWVGLLNQGQSVADVANTMYATAPARAYYPAFLTNGEIIASFYVNVLGREADAEGLAYWTAKLNEAGATPGSVIAEMIDVVANYTGTDPDGLASQALFNNRVEVAQYYGEKNGTIDGATAVLSGVTADPASVDTAKENIDNGTIPGVNQGQTFTLTDTKDTIVGTSGNDTIDAIPGGSILGAAATTLQAYDSIDGGAGLDTMNIYAGLAIAGTALPYNWQQTGTVKNVEVINIYNDATTGVYFGEDQGGIDASKFQGAQQIWQNGVAGDVWKVGQDVTLGFRNVQYSGEDYEIDVDLLDGVTAANLVLDQTGEDINFDVEGKNLDTLTISGQALWAEGEDAWVDLNVVTSSTKLTLNTEVNTNLYVRNSKLTEVDAGESTGSIWVDGEDQLQTVTTGAGEDYVYSYYATTAAKGYTVTTNAGEDYVYLSTTGAGSTTVDTGEGDDYIDVYTASKTLSIDAGAGDDYLYVGEDAAPTKLTADMGAGDDEVALTYMTLADVPAAWVIDGGEGDDTVAIGAGTARTFVAGDYVALTESLKNFENLDLLASGSEYTIDASRIGGYDSVALIGEDNTLNISKVSAEQTLGLSGDGSALNATAAGYKAATDTAAAVYGGDLNVVVERLGEDAEATSVDANGSKLTLTLDGTLYEDNEWYYGENVTLESNTVLTGDIQTLNVNLNSVVLNNGEDGVDLEDVGVSHVSLTLATTGEDLSALTSVTVSGKGSVVINNGADSKLVNVDASGLTGLSWDAVNGAAANGQGLSYTSSNAAAETVKLSGGVDFVGLAASSVAKMDSIEGLTLVAATAGGLDLAKSDLLAVGVGAGDYAELSASQASAVAALGSLNLALQYVAQQTSDNVVFHYGGNTYVYSDALVDVENQLDDTDFLVQLTGTIDLELLVASLNAVV